MDKALTKILLIINPKSGTERSREIIDAMEEVMPSKSISWDVYYTKGENDPEQINRILQDFEPELLIACGGDGTINMLLPLLVETKLKLGIIPSGSANGLASNLNLPFNPEKALKSIVNGTAHPTDILLINKRHHCIHLSDIGINARIVKRFQQEKSKGFLGYGKQLFKELFSGKSAFRFHLETDKKHKKYKAEMLILANAKAFGTGAIVNPYGKMNDGFFEVVIIKPYPWWAVFNLLYTSFTGQLHKMEYVRVHSMQQAKIKFKEAQELQIDGEVVDNVSKINVDVVPGAINLVYSD